MIEINKIETGKRIRKLRETAAETQEELAKSLKVKRQIISYYENGTRVPTLEHLIFIADHYNTTTDYLLCLYDVPTTDKDLQFICKYTGLKDDVLDNLTHNPKCLDVLNYLLADGNILNFVILCVFLKEYQEKHLNLIEFMEQTIEKKNQVYGEYKKLLDSCDLIEYQIKKQFDVILSSFCKSEKDKIIQLDKDVLTVIFGNSNGEMYNE